MKLRFTVRDSGIGIPEEKRCLLFQSFTQLDPTASRSHGGTGLGLVISKRLIERMGGEIQVESTHGKGSTFSFELELPIGEDAVEFLRPAADLAGMKALVLDDNQTNALVVKRALERWGLTVELAASGAQALEFFHAALNAGEPFGIALLDLHLPDMDGFAVAEELRKIVSVRDLAIMMNTSDDVPGGARRARELGIGAYLVKPIRLSPLAEAVQALRGDPSRLSDLVASVGSARSASEAQRPQLARIRVLVVEDNPVNRIYAEALLKKQGIRVSSAGNGKEALEILASESFDLVLMDVQMPEMDGLEATRALRQRGFDTPIIGLTAHALKGDREKCLEAGMDDYLSKPVSPDLLYAKISEWARTRSGEPIDVEDIVSTLGGDRNVFHAIVQKFREEAPARIAEVRKALECADCTMLGRAAHRLRGSLLVLKAQEALGLADELESCGRTGALSGAQGLYERLHAELERILRFLEPSSPA